MLIGHFSFLVKLHLKWLSLNADSDWHPPNRSTGNSTSEGSSSSSKPKGLSSWQWAQGCKTGGQLYHQVSRAPVFNSCHEISRWEWKLLGRRFLPTSDQHSHATTWQNEVLHWKHLDWTKHKAMCLSWIGRCPGRSSTPLLLNKKSTSGILFRAMESLAVQISGLTYVWPVWPWGELSFLCLDSLPTKWVVCWCCAGCSNQGLFPIISYPKSRRAGFWTGLESLHMISNTHEDIFPHMRVTLPQQSQRMKIIIRRIKISSLMRRVVCLSLVVSKLTFWDHFICFLITLIRMLSPSSLQLRMLWPLQNASWLTFARSFLEKLLPGSSSMYLWSRPVICPWVTGWTMG